MGIDHKSELDKVTLHLDDQVGAPAGWVARIHYSYTGAGARRQSGVEEECIGPSTESAVGPDFDKSELDDLPTQEEAVEMTVEAFDWLDIDAEDIEILE